MLGNLCSRGHLPVPGDDFLSDVGDVDLSDDSGSLPVPVLEETVDLDRELHDVAGGPEVVSLDSVV